MLRVGENPVKRLNDVYGDLDSYITVDWHAISTATGNTEKTEEGGPLRAYVRRLECTHSCEEFSIKCYAKQAQSA